MPLIYLPQWSTANVAFTVLQVLGLTAIVLELKGVNAGYSKFANPKAGFKLPSRLGMVLLYSPALVVSLLYLTTSENVNGREQITGLLLALHFAKRVLECLFLHKYSGTMDGDFLIQTGSVYGLVTALILHEQKSVAMYADSQGSDVMLFVGLLFSAVGQLGNLYHHWLLMRLRSEPSKSKQLSKSLLESGNAAEASSDAAKASPEEASGAQQAAAKGYVIPKDGLFKYVTAPHYFFELIAWLGIAFTAQQLNAFLAVADMLSYLAGRSVATTRWYRSKFPDYPPERKHLIPFIF